jgi:hypothetical protein
MGKNLFRNYNSGYNRKQWYDYLPLNKYSIKKTEDLPEFIKKNGLTTKFNSALVVASGSTLFDFYGVIGYRPDKGNTVVDEHAFVYLINKETDEVIGGILDHADYNGRTTYIPTNIQEALTISGVTANISFPRMPDVPEGDLNDLINKGLINGVSENFNISFRKLMNDDR